MRTKAFVALSVGGCFVTSKELMMVTASEDLRDLRALAQVGVTKLQGLTPII